MKGQICTVTNISSLVNQTALTFIPCYLCFTSETQQSKWKTFIDFIRLWIRPVLNHRFCLGLLHHSFESKRSISFYLWDSTRKCSTLFQDTLW